MNARYAGTRVFSGDWEYHEAAGAYLFAFEAAEELEYGLPDGFVHPIVTGRVLEAIAARQTLLSLADDGIAFTTLEDQHDGRWIARLADYCDEEGCDCNEVVLSPLADGTYDLGPLGICWSAVGADENVCTLIAP